MSEPLTTVEERAAWTRGGGGCIDAIKALRERTGLGLVDAKELLELETGRLLNPPPRERDVTCPTCGGCGAVKERLP